MSEVMSVAISNLAGILMITEGILVSCQYMCVYLYYVGKAAESQHTAETRTNR